MNRPREGRLPAYIIDLRSHPLRTGVRGSLSPDPRAVSSGIPPESPVPVGLSFENTRLRKRVSDSPPSTSPPPPPFPVVPRGNVGGGSRTVLILEPPWHITFLVRMDPYTTKVPMGCPRRPVVCPTVPGGPPVWSDPAVPEPTVVDATSSSGTAYYGPTPPLRPLGLRI